MKKLFSILLVLIGCSGTGISTEASLPEIDSGEQSITICEPIPYERACQGVTCGNAKDGCGHYYVCVARPAWACGCKQDNIPVCKPGNVPYFCPDNIIPSFCYKINKPDNYWCCPNF